MREAFEKWVVEERCYSIEKIVPNGLLYKERETRIAWRVWQAACMGVVEKLKPCEFDTLRWNEKEQQYDETTVVEMSDVYEVLSDNH